MEALADDWDPKEYKDTYRETLRAAIEQKVQGKEITAPKLPDRDLMEALQASLARKDLMTAPRRATAAEKPAAKGRCRAGGRTTAA